MAEQFSYKNFSETDIDLIKESLKSHLKNQDEFKDFNFEGSAINVLMNLLAYNTQYNAYYVNMLASESFISHAQKRESVVGLANNLGYVPRSRRPSTAVLSFEITPDSGYTNPITLPKDAKFTAEIDGVSYPFLTTSAAVASINTNGVYVFADIEIKQGRKFTHRYVVDESTKFFALPNKGVDTERISVKVHSTPNSIDYVEYQKFTNLTQLTDLSVVFFVQETYNQQHEIYFGDNVLGVAPAIGNEIVIEYYISDGALANNATVFSLDEEVTGVSSIEFTEIVQSLGGAEIESTDSVRLAASSNYVSQNRAVTVNDYDTIIRKLYPDIVNISVWGGDTATPKQYGKVFISVLRENNQFVTERVKQNILTEIRSNYSVLAVVHEIVDPVRLYLELDISAFYDTAKLTNTSIGQISNDIAVAVSNYASTELSKFNAKYLESRVLPIIDNSSVAIESSGVDVRFYFKFSDIISYNNPNTITFAQAIQVGSVITSELTYGGVPNCIIIDNNGILAVYQFNNTNGKYDILINSNIGTVNYASGTLSYTSNDVTVVEIFRTSTVDIKVYAKPSMNDVIGKNDTILLLNQSDVTIELLNGR